METGCPGRKEYRELDRLKEGNSLERRASGDTGFWSLHQGDVSSLVGDGALRNSTCNTN